ncbi:MAG TPA: hypothetical protein VJR89_42215, partial [Polyangiales bacterium]|nr:hypothetical protein [Polyangiales bacterium]
MPGGEAVHDVGSDCRSAAGASAAKPSVQSSAAPTPSVIVRLEPADGETDVKQSALAIVVDTNSGTSALSTTLDTLSQRVHLLTWPERHEVAIDTSVSNGSRTGITVSPKTQLDEGWYVLEAGPLPAFTRWNSADGAGSSRFRIGSEPMLRSIAVCENGAGPAKLLVRTSEAVVVREPVAEHVAVRSRGRDVDCQTVQVTADSIELTCNLPSCESITVSLDEAFSAKASPDTPTEGSSAEFSFD